MTKNPQNTTVRAAEIETGGQKKEDPTEFSSSKARNQLRQTHGTLEQLWCMPFLVAVMAKMFLTQHIKLLLLKYGKGKLHATGYFRSIESMYHLWAHQHQTEFHIVNLNTKTLPSEATDTEKETTAACASKCNTAQLSLQRPRLLGPRLNFL